MAGTAILAFCYYYLFLQDQKKYLKVWSISWALYFLRFVFMLAFLLWEKDPLFLIGNQVASLVSGVLLLYGSYLFIERIFPRIFLYFSLLDVFWIIYSILGDLPFLVMSLPTFGFLALIYIWTGYIFLKQSQGVEKEAKIIGWAFIVWGLHKADYPFLRPAVWFAPWGYLLGAVMEFITALGLILVYFRKTKNALIDNQNRLMKAQQIAKIGDWSWELQDNQLSWSDETYNIFGQSPEKFQVTVEAFEKFIHPDDYDRFISERDAALSQNRDVDIEHRIVLPDKSVRWVHELSSVERNNDGDVIKITGTVQDITERKGSEKALLESQERFTLAMEASQDGLFDWDLVTNEIYYSPGWKRLLGYADHEIKNDFSEWERLTKPEHVKASFTMLNEVMKGTRERFESEFQMLHKNGHWVDILSRATVIFDEQGKGVRVIGTHVDLTARKESERALQESEKQHRSIIATAMDGFWLTDAQGRLLEVNDTYIRMSGYSEQELLALYISDLEAMESPEDVKDRIEKVIQDGEDRFESKHRRKDGTLFDVEVSVQYWRTAGGRLVSFIRDITEQKIAQEKLQQAQKMESIGNLAGGIAHDFNNILSPIIGVSELLMEDFPTESLEYENTKQIFRAGLRGADLVRQILAFSRQSEHKLIPVHIQQVLKEVLKLSRSSIPTYIEIEQDIQADCGMVLADATQIHQVAMNIITNAYHAVEPTGGKIMVTLHETSLTPDELLDRSHSANRYARLSVADNGHGMSSDLMDKIFEPYFTTKEQGKGTGLGLAVAYGIIKEHQGAIKVASEEGKGTTFSIYIPLMEAPAEIESVDGPAAIETGDEHILLVDDEEPLANLEKQMLERLGYKVTSRLNSVDALAAFKAHPSSFDLVISDMSMPNMTGDELAKELKKIKPDLPIIICTGFSERINKEKAELSGINDFIMKPIIRAKLAKKVRNVLDAIKFENQT
jgi:PAS domain S-box-containing protein